MPWLPIHWMGATCKIVKSRAWRQLKSLPTAWLMLWDDWTGNSEKKKSTNVQKTLICGRHPDYTQCLSPTHSAPHKVYKNLKKTNYAHELSNTWSATQLWTVVNLAFAQATRRKRLTKALHSVFPIVLGERQSKQQSDGGKRCQERRLRGNKKENQLCEFVSSTCANKTKKRRLPWHRLSYLKPGCEKVDEWPSGSRQHSECQACINIFQMSSGARITGREKIARFREKQQFLHIRKRVLRGVHNATKQHSAYRALKSVKAFSEMGRSPNNASIVMRFEHTPGKVLPRKTKKERKLCRSETRKSKQTHSNSQTSEVQAVRLGSDQIERFGRLRNIRLISSSARWAMCAAQFYVQSHVDLTS